MHDKNSTPAAVRLNPHQQAAVDCDDDRILVKAGAGSGKTQVLTRRIARLMDAGYHPKEILALTFTRAAAAEMRERIVKLVGPRGKLLQVSTFHSWACALLREWHEVLGLSREFSIYDEQDYDDLLTHAAETFGDEKLRKAKQRHAAKVDRMKAAGVPADKLPVWKLHPATRKRLEKDVAIMARVHQLLREAQALTFDMLESELVRLLDHDAPRAELRRRYEHILVDEAQDTSRGQQDILDALVPQVLDQAGVRNLFVVGDHAQAIYGFRGADVEGFMGLADREGWTCLSLPTNYRSLPPIVDVANRCAARMAVPGLEMDAAREDEEEPVCTITGQDRDELHAHIAADVERTCRAMGYGYPWAGMEPADFHPDPDCSTEDERAAHMAALRDSQAAKPDETSVSGPGYHISRTPWGLGTYTHQAVPWKDCAILAPTWNLLHRLAPALEAAGIPHRIAKRALDVWETQEARWAIDCLRVACNPWDHNSLRRALGAFRGRVSAGKWAKARASALGLGVSVVDVAAELGFAPSIMQAITMGRLLLVTDDHLSADGAFRAIRSALQRELRALHLDTKAQGLDVLAEAFDAWLAAQPEDERTVQHLLTWYAGRKITDPEVQPEDEDQVVLTTIHGAKGLEWPCVWVIGLEEGYLPRKKPTAEQLEESRRLFYVAATRARDRLRLCWSGHKEPSRFLGEVSA